MAGHSKWKNIQHRKGRQDKARSSLFGKLGRQITVAVKVGKNSDPEMNPRLRLAIQNAKGARMPKDIINRAIEKGAGDTTGQNMEDIRYEGFGPHGVGFIVEGSTDNKNRAAAQVREQFRKNGGALGESGSVSFMFSHVGRITYPFSAATDDEMMESALEAGAEDVVQESDDNADDEDEDHSVHAIYTSRDSLASVASDLEKKHGTATSVNLIWKSNTPPSNNPDASESVERLKDGLSELDDVTSVHTNYDDSSSVETFQKVSLRGPILPSAISHSAHDRSLPLLPVVSAALALMPIISLWVIRRQSQKARR